MTPESFTPVQIDEPTIRCLLDMGLNDPSPNVRSAALCIVDAWRAREPKPKAELAEMWAVMRCAVMRAP